MSPFHLYVKQSLENLLMPTENNYLKKFGAQLLCLPFPVLLTPLQWVVSENALY